MRTNTFIRRNPRGLDEFCLLVEGKKVGQVEFSQIKNEFNIDWVEICEKYRGNGYGALLIEGFNKLIQKYNGTGFLVDSISSDCNAKGLYERHGWKKDGLQMTYSGCQKNESVKSIGNLESSKKERKNE